MSSSLSAVFAVGQARGARHLRKKVATQGNGGGGGVLSGKAKAQGREKRAATKQISSRESRGRERRGCWNNAPLAAGAVAKSSARVCVCVCVKATFFFVLIELICCLFSAAS